MQRYNKKWTFARKRAIICKKDRYLSEIWFHRSAGVYSQMSECNYISKGVNRFFANNCERPVVWAALCERTFEVVECPTDTRPVPSKYNKKLHFMGCISRTYFRGGWVSKGYETGVLEGTTGRLMRGRSPHICSSLKYGLHLANVASRRDPLSGRCNRSTTKNAHLLLSR